MDPNLHYRQQSPQELDDHVATFVEQELGRHDWMHNWPAWKTKYPNYREKIRSFFWQLGVDIDPDDVIRHIDNMILTRPGRWR